MNEEEIKEKTKKFQSLVREYHGSSKKITAKKKLEYIQHYLENNQQKPRDIGLEVIMESNLEEIQNDYLASKEQRKEAVMLIEQLDLKTPEETKERISQVKLEKKIKKILGKDYNSSGGIENYKKFLEINKKKENTPLKSIPTKQSEELKKKIPEEFKDVSKKIDSIIKDREEKFVKTPLSSRSSKGKNSKLYQDLKKSKPKRQGEEDLGLFAGMVSFVSNSLVKEVKKLISSTISTKPTRNASSTHEKSVEDKDRVQNLKPKSAQEMISGFRKLGSRQESVPLIPRTPKDKGTRGSGGGRGSF